MCACGVIAYGSLHPENDVKKARTTFKPAGFGNLAIQSKKSFLSKRHAQFSEYNQFFFKHRDIKIGIVIQQIKITICHCSPIFLFEKYEQ